MADTLVALFVMPFHIAFLITEGKWIFGTYVCHFFLTLDILLCTSSILHLCCIALDRYWAIKDSIKYAQKRTMSRVLLMILIAWLSSALISLPVIIWNTKTVGVQIVNTKANNFDSTAIRTFSNRTLLNRPENKNSKIDFKSFTSSEALNIENENSTTLETPGEHNLVCDIPHDKLYRIYSSSGTFWVPLSIMAFVYIQIYKETKRRLRERAKAAKKLAKSMAHSTGQNYDTKNENKCNKLFWNIFCCCCIKFNQILIKANAHKIQKIHTNLDLQQDARSNCFKRNPEQSELNKTKDLKLTNKTETSGLIREETISLNRSQQDSEINEEKFLGYEKNLSPSSRSSSDTRSPTDHLREFELISKIENCNDSEIMIDNSDIAHNEPSDNFEKKAQKISQKKSKPLVIIVESPSMFEPDSPKRKSLNKGREMSIVECVSIGTNTGIMNQIDKTTKTQISLWSRDNAANTGNTLKQRQKISLTRERKAARTLGIIMGSFTICWFPFFIVYLLQAWAYFQNEKLFLLLTWLGYVNSALNPVIYTVFNMDFRKSFKRILFNCILCKKISY